MLSFKSFSLAGAALVTLLGGAVLVGWLFGIESLTSILPGLGAMHASTGLALALAGIALMTLGSKERGLAVRIMAQFFSFLVALIGFLSLAEFLLGIEVGPEFWLSEIRPGSAATDALAGVPLAASCSLMLIGSALSLLLVRRNLRLVRYLTYAVMTISTIAVVGQAFAVESLASTPFYARMGVHTAWSLLVLSLALLFAHPDRVHVSRRIIETIVITASYLLAAKMSFSMAIPPGNVSVVWPPSGIALAAILLLGERAWLGVWLGSFIANTWFFAGMTNPFSMLAFLTSSIIGIGSTLQAVLGALMIRNFVGSEDPLDGAQSVFALVVIEVYCCFVAPTFGVTALCLAGYAPWENYSHLWWTWWTGDGVGVILFAPFLLSWSRLPRVSFNPKRFFEGAALAILTFAVCQYVFEWPLSLEAVHYPSPYLIIPFVVWAALRFGRKGVTLSLLGVSIVAIASTAAGLGPFSSQDGHGGLSLLQTYLGFLSIPVLILAAALDNFRKSNRELADIRGELETLVRKKTGDLKSAHEALKAEADGRRETEEERRKGEEQLRLILSRVTDNAIFMLDPKGIIVNWGEGARAIHGYDAEEITGRHFSMLYPDDELKWGKPDIELEIAREEGRLEDEGWRLRKDGSLYWASVVITALRDSGGRLQGFAAITRDITSRRKAEEELLRDRKELQDFIDGMSTLTAKVALDGSLLLVNRIARLATGLPLERLMKTNFLDGDWWAFDPEVQARVRESFRQACAGAPVNYDEKLFVFGKVIVINFSLVPVKDADGKVLYIVAEGRDITAQKSAEEAVRDSGQRIRSLAKELDRRIAELAAVNKELEAFSYSVSHDLRTPLRHIGGFVDLLKEELGESQGGKGRHYLEVISNSTAHMGNLIDDLLLFSRMARVALQRSTIDIGQIVGETIRSLEPDTKQREIEWKVGDLPRVEADGSLMRLVFQNLLSNALKYTRPRTKAVIEVGWAESNGHEASFYVRDNGVGFDMQFADKLFGVFQRLHKPEEFEGTGIGLANVRRIVQRHGGRTWAEGEVDRGATFYFSLPTNQES